MTDLSKMLPQQYEKYCTNFHLPPNAPPIDIIKSYRSCCAIMEIEPGSNLETIRNAYKRLCNVRHLGKASGSAEALQELIKANEMLSAYIELSNGKCDQPFTSSNVRLATTTASTNFIADVKSFSPQRMMALRVVTVLAHQHMSVVKFTSQDFFAARLQTIDEALRKLLAHMKELLAFPFQFANRLSIENLNDSIDILLSQYEKTNSMGKLTIHRALSSLCMFFSAIKRMNSYFDEIISDQKILDMMNLLGRNDVLSATHEDKKTATPHLLFFTPLPDEQKPLLPVNDPSDIKQSENWLCSIFCGR